MNNNPLISIIIPVYNVEKYLNKCVDSVVNQTYSNLEIILVDDGSPDNCPKMCDDWALTDNRIKVIHKKNGGLPSARNAGIDIANGDYISFVDSDDFIHPKMIEILYNNLVQTKSDISICGYNSFFETEKTITNLETKNNVVTFNKDNLEQIFRLNSTRVSVISAWAKLFKSYIFKEIRFLEELKKIEDLNFTMKVFAFADKICITKTPMYFYLLRSGSIMRSQSYPLDYSLKSCNNAIDYYNNADIKPEFRKKMVNILLLNKANQIMDAYYFYCLKKQSDKKAECKKLFNQLKPELKERNIKTFKIRLFETSSFIYRIAMRFYISRDN